MTPAEPIPRILMHEYRCPRCKFRWFQQNLVEREICISCGKWPVKSERSEMRELRLVVPHKKIES